MTQLTTLKKRAKQRMKVLGHDVQWSMLRAHRRGHNGLVVGVCCRCFQHIELRRSGAPSILGRAYTERCNEGGGTMDCWHCNRPLAVLRGKPLFTIVTIDGVRHRVHKVCAVTIRTTKPYAHLTAQPLTDRDLVERRKTIDDEGEGP